MDIRESGVRMGAAVGSRASMGRIVRLRFRPRSVSALPREDELSFAAEFGKRGCEPFFGSAFPGIEGMLVAHR